MMLQDNQSNDDFSFPVLEARFDSGHALMGLLGSLFIAGICIWAGEHYALIGGLIGLFGIAFSLRGMIDSRVRLRIDAEGVHLPNTQTTMTWWDIDQATWRVVTRGASQRAFVVFNLCDGRSVQVNVSELNVSLSDVCTLVEHCLDAKAAAHASWS